MAKTSTVRFPKLALLATAFLSLCCDQGTLPIQPSGFSGKADLVIDKITYVRMPNVIHDQYGGILIAPPTFEFTLTIRNIGAVPVTSALFICNSHSQTDFDAHYCSSGCRTNDPPATIPAGGGAIDVKFTTYVDLDTPNVLFVLNTDDMYQENLNLPEVEEINYDNNSYTLAMEW